MKNINEREQLVRKLQDKGWGQGDNDFGSWDCSEEIADFIIADRKRICKPLIECLNDKDIYPIEAIRKSLKLAGLLETIK